MTISKGLVFDIKRFAVHDGAGIRTTVFFKGCPLHCKWCQNPEGILSVKRPVYIANKCIHCKRCVGVAKENQITYYDRPYFNDNYQGSFDNLVKFCPTNAIRYDSQEYSIEELMEEINKDKVFYKHGGGVTFSGGEPLMHKDFLVEILKRCKEEKIHTAIETTVYADIDLIKEVLPYLDLIYIDLKVYDETLHQQLTNVSSKLIKEHIQYILESEHKNKVIIRTPLIPSMNASDDNIRDIASFLVNIYPEVKYELLNYNPLASSKYDLVDFEYGVDLKYKMYTKEQMQHFYDIVYQTGLKNLIRE